MWIDNAVFKEDMDSILSYECIEWEQLRDKTVLVTGATGLIGYTLVSSLAYANVKYDLHIKVIALVRDITKARIKFAEQIQYTDCVSFIVGSVENLPKIDINIDYIIHGANPTESAFFVTHPVETITISVRGTINLLELAHAKSIKSFIYLSSMEVYGAPQTDDAISETQGTTVDTMAVRSSYPEAKRLCECLCASYSSEYNVPAKVVRLAQTFGPGVAVDDNRVFAEFARNVMHGEDIVLKTAGKSKRCYLYTADAVTAILAVLLLGKDGEAYNIANPSTYCSIVEMAGMMVSAVAKNSIKVLLPHEEISVQKYLPYHKLNLSIDKIHSLGWRPQVDLIHCYLRLLKSRR